MKRLVIGVIFSILANTFLLGANSDKTEENKWLKANSIDSNTYIYEPPRALVKTSIMMMRMDGIKTPELLIRWIKAQNKISNNTVKFESGLVRWYASKGINTPEELLAHYGNSEQWVVLGINADSIKDWKYNGFKTPKEAEKWTKLGIKSPWTATKLIDNGFTAVSYKPYKDIEIAKAIKLKNWGIKANKLVESISKLQYTNYFDSKNNFMEIYSPMKDKCIKFNNTYLWKSHSSNKSSNECYIVKYSNIKELSKNQILLITKDKKRIKKHNISQKEYNKMDTLEIIEASKKDQKNNFKHFNKYISVKPNGHEISKKYGSVIVKIIDGSYSIDGFNAPISEILYVYKK